MINKYKRNKMEILNSTNNDIEEIFKLYKAATDFQKTKAVVRWLEFDRELIKNEIEDGRQWKVILDNQVACIWATTFSDPLIWEDRNNDLAVYIHRIATNRDFKGRNLVSKIVEWARQYAKANGKEFIRMDTVGNNEKLIDYYKTCGFNFLGLSKLKDTSSLPTHYKNGTVSLFEIQLSKKTTEIANVEDSKKPSLY